MKDIEELKEEVESQEEDIEEQDEEIVKLKDLIKGLQGILEMYSSRPLICYPLNCSTLP